MSYFTRWPPLPTGMFLSLEAVEGSTLKKVRTKNAHQNVNDPITPGKAELVE